MADYSMLGSLGSGGASALSGDLLTKLRTAEEKSVVSMTWVDCWKDKNLKGRITGATKAPEGAKHLLGGEGGGSGGGEFTEALSP